MSRYVTLSQGEVFYTTEMLAVLEGMERGPAGNTSLAAAFCLARELPENALIVVQETEYTGAGKHQGAQLAFARENGVRIAAGDPRDEVPGESIILPEHPGQIQAQELDMDHLRRSLIKNALGGKAVLPNDGDLDFLAAETRSDTAFVRETIKQLLEGYDEKG